MSLEHSPDKQRRGGIGHNGGPPLASETPASYTLPQWLARHQLSRGHWYRLKAANNAPDTYGTGKAQRISPAADARWVKAQERKAKQSQSV